MDSVTSILGAKWILGTLCECPFGVGLACSHFPCSVQFGCICSVTSSLWVQLSLGT